MKIFTSLLTVSLLSVTLAASLFGSQMSTLLFGAAATQPPANPKKTGDQSATDPGAAKTDGIAAAEKLRIANGARDMLERCRSTLDGYQSYRTLLKEEVNVAGQKFTATGEYIKGPDLKHRLELKLEIGSGPQKTKASLIQVCDGQILKSEQQIGKTKLTSRRNVKQIIDAATRNLNGREDLRKNLIADMGIGGITGLIASLQRTMVFDTQTAGTTGTKKTYTLEGGWNAATVIYWTELNGGAIPTHVPDRVRVLIDSDYLVRQIVYLKLDRKDPSKKPTPMLTLNFHDIVVNAKFDNKTFEYDIDQRVFTEDATDRYIQMINALNAQNATSP